MGQALETSCPPNHTNPPILQIEIRYTKNISITSLQLVPLLIDLLLHKQNYGHEWGPHTNLQPSYYVQMIDGKRFTYHWSRMICFGD